MITKGFFQQYSAGTQALLLIFLFCGGAVIATLITMLISLFTGISGMDMSMTRVVQTISSLGLFLLPAIGMALFCDASPRHYLSLHRVNDERVWLLVLASMFLIAAPINFIAMLNQQMELPTFMAPVEQWMRSQEDLAQQLTQNMIGDGTPQLLAINLIVMALCPAITEEFFFRGALQRLIGKWNSNPHFVIWSAAILFSAFHLQFYGFIPRMLLGAYLGYLLLWTRSIWIPVFAHFINNATAVIGMSDKNLRESALVTGEIPTDQVFQYGIAAAISLILFIFLNQYLKKILKGQSDKS